ncbi:glutamate 5-kinase [Fretibacter rubidus]|uniref:glutamate 5-kinase n=1 Tax=Fretibacter rubidus TaxID=570162 RepID=UPI00352A11C0
MVAAALHSPLSQSKRIVIKIGSALLIDAQTGTLRSDWLSTVADDIAGLKSRGVDVVIVSSGAIALGRKRLGLNGTLSLSEKQACAAAGQSELTRAYERALEPHHIVTAQALLTLTDTEDRRRWLNARGTLQTLIKLGAVPIVNENDTVATDEIRYGDNDRLAARVAQMLGADTLVLLSDIDGLYTDDPRKNSTAKHLPLIDSLTPDIMAMGGDANAGAQVGTGGMATKLLAAKIAVDAGCSMVIMDGQAPSPLSRLMNGATCSVFKASGDPAGARAQWIMGALKPKGTLHIDGGAAGAITKGSSLLAAGITDVSGDFVKGDTVLVMDLNDVEVARGLIGYSAVEARHIMGRKSDEISAILGYDNGAAVIHRDNMVITS